MSLKGNSHHFVTPFFHVSRAPPCHTLRGGFPAFLNLYVSMFYSDLTTVVLKVSVLIFQKAFWSFCGRNLKASDLQGSQRFIQESVELAAKELCRTNRYLCTGKIYLFYL